MCVKWIVEKTGIDESHMRYGSVEGCERISLASSSSNNNSNSGTFIRAANKVKNGERRSGWARENCQYNGLAECSRKSLGCANIDVFTASKVIDRLSSWPFYRAKQQIILDTYTYTYIRTYTHTYIYVCGHILTKLYASNVTEGDHSVATCLAFGSGSQDKT